MIRVGKAAGEVTEQLFPLKDDYTDFKKDFTDWFL